MISRVKFTFECIAFHQGLKHTAREDDLYGPVRPAMQIINIYVASALKKDAAK